LLTYEVDTGDLVHEVSTNIFVGIEIDGERLYALRRRSADWVLEIYKLNDAGREPVPEGNISLEGGLPPLESIPAFCV
jgi:hypothetical protein